MKLRLWPLKQRQANAYVSTHHRHHGPVRGDLFRVGVVAGDELVGVAIVGRPVSRETQRREPQTCELLRLCTIGGGRTRDRRGREHADGIASMLQSAVRRAAWALGYTRIITYTLKSESGRSLKAAGYRTVGEIKGRSWDTPSRPRVDKTAVQDRLLWEDRA